VANGRFAKENEINKESGRCKDRVSIIPRAKVKELPFAFAEDLKGGRAEPERDRERRLWGEGEGTRQGDGEKKKKGKGGRRCRSLSAGSPISETITILLSVVAEASGPGR